MVKRILLSTIIACALWQGLINFFKLPTYILPSPIEVLHALWHYKSLLALESIPTIIETLIGFFAGILLGCIAAITLTYLKSARRWFLPVLIASQAIPTFAIAPLLVLWFGYGMPSKIVVTIIMLFFPVTSNFYDGLQKTPQSYLDVAKTMHTSRWRCLLKIQIPAALPNLGAGIRVASTIAPIGAIVGEWVGASKGLGFLMLNANARMQIDMMFAALIIIIIMSLTLYFIVDATIKKIVYWSVT